MAKTPVAIHKTAPGQSTLGIQLAGGVTHEVTMPTEEVPAYLQALWVNGFSEKLAMGSVLHWEVAHHPPHRIIVVFQRRAK